jgi:hypothetical protein
MKYRKLRGLLAAAAAIACMVAASPAMAVSDDPFSPSLADIQALGDVTPGFNTNQLSTIDAIHLAPDGIHLDITWRVGQNSDPFGPDFGATFPRVSLARYTNGEDGGQGRLLFPRYNHPDWYDGIKWCIMTDTNNFVQPFIQTAPNWTFYEPTPGGYGIPGDMSMQMVTLDFNDARNFSGLLPNNIVHPDGNGQIRSNAFGLQIVGPGGMVPGQPIPGHVWITRWIPEPTTATLLLVGIAGVLGFGRRRS